MKCILITIIIHSALCLGKKKLITYYFYIYIKLFLYHIMPTCELYHKTTSWNSHISQQIE